MKLTEEQELQSRMDGQNITIQLLMKGDGENFPVINFFSIVIDFFLLMMVYTDNWRYCSCEIYLYFIRWKGIYIYLIHQYYFYYF